MESTGVKLACCAVKLTRRALSMFQNVLVPVLIMRAAASA
jgi:hypothetical protein